MHSDCSGQDAPGPPAGPAHVQTKREIESMLDLAGLRPRKRLGQHFLIDGNLMRRLVEEAGLTQEDVVLEVGAGTGGLTDLLVQRAGRVISVEVDGDLCGLLRDRFAGVDHFTLLNTDVLASKHRLSDALIHELNRIEPASSGESSLKLVANLPYHVATPLLMNLLIDYPQVRRFVFTVQAEVGERLIAKPNTRDYGPLAILAQTLGRVETITRLPPQVFWPRPAVDSVMMRMEVMPLPFDDRDRLQRFTRLVRSTFAHRRKTLRTALGYVVSAGQRDRVCEHFDGSRRPESLSRDEWRCLFDFISDDSL
jgi:16S rRNA (adenine1518-N6/adenine1519-N6)-dimethyltransferase